MAQKVIHIDDLDQSPDAERVRFSLNGTNYTIDLSAENLADLEEKLRPFIEAATEVAATARKAVANPGRMQKIRAWALDNGHDVASRGRIPQTVIDAYEWAMSQGDEGGEDEVTVAVVDED